MLKTLALVVLSMSLLGCNASKLRATGHPAAGAMPATEARGLPALGKYHLDAARSELRVLVYKAGALANLGHNHVLINRSLTGQIDVGDTLTSTSFALCVPVTGFVVDDALARQQAGEDFPGEISADAKAGTLHNLLSAALLDVAAHPDITVHGVGGVSASGQITVSLDFEVAGHRSSLVLPLSWQSELHGFNANGSADITQTSLGLKPYSLLMGALQVQDALHIEYILVALADDVSTAASPP